MKHAIMIPAIMPTYSSYFAWTDEKLFEKSPNLRNAGKTSRWPCEKDAFIYYPYILLSAAHHYTKENFRESCKFTDETHVMVDSGGYQIATGVVSKKFNNEVALKWSEENGNVYPILDRPITAGAIWEDNIKLTKESAKYYIENRTAKGHHILNVVSGKGRTDVDRWYNAVKQFSCDLDGWSHGGHRGNIKSIMSTLFYMFNKGVFDKDEINYYHVFGVASFDAMFYIEAFQYWLHSIGRTTTQITYDSSNQTKVLAYGNLIYSSDWRGIKFLLLSNKIEFNEQMPMFYCDCPVCKNITDPKSLFVTNREFEFYYILHQHNLYQLLKMKKIVEWMIEVSNDFCYDTKMLEGTIPRKYQKNIIVLRKAFADPLNAESTIANEFKWASTDSLSNNNVSLSDFMA